MKDVNPNACEQNPQVPAEQEQSRCCSCSCKRLKFTSILLIVLIVFCGGAVYWWLYTRIFSLDEYRAAMKKIDGAPGLLQEIGQPILVVGWPPPSARLESGEKDIRWEIEGPKGRAKAHVLIQRRAGQWETIISEVFLPSGKKVSLIDPSDNSADAPKFESPKPTEKKTSENTPPPEIKFDIPAGDGPPGK